MAANVRRSGGNFRDKKLNVKEISFSDWQNPWNFYGLFSKSDDVVLEWLRDNGLLARTVPCHKCDGSMFLKSKADRSGGQIFRCRTNRMHQKSMRRFSLFEMMNIEIQDALVFIKSYLDKMTLRQCALFSGTAYGTTAVNWASYIRELFKEHFHRHIRHKRLGGEVEIDESLFGRRVKFHRGNPNKGLKVWIFGLVDRTTNTVVVYPVSDRTEATLLPIIQRHVLPGSTIYSDGWSAYYNLNDAGYNHFTVLHKYAFKKEYRNKATGAIVTVHTNRIEGAWKHAKDHFRRIVGTKSQQFEGHLAEIMWRSENKGRFYEKFFELLREVYTLDSAPNYDYTTPLFDSWDGPEHIGSNDADNIEDRVFPIESGAETSESEPEDEPQPGPSRIMTPIPRSSALFPAGVVIPSDSDSDADQTIVAAQSTPPLRRSPRKRDDRNTAGSTPPLRRSPRKKDGESTSAIGSANSSPPLRSGPRIKITKRKQTTVSKTENVRHPSGFEQVTVEGTRRKQTRKSNQYARSAFVWDLDHDEDFI